MSARLNQRNQWKGLDKDAYSVGCICALKIEAAALTALLDERHQDLYAEPGDKNTYAFGRIGKHNVIIAYLPAGQYGSISAGIVAEGMFRTFTDSLRVCLLVGIGGGIPAAGRDLQFGDVVVSRPEGQHGGVIHWDMGQSLTGGFRRTGQLNAPSQVLLGALAKLQAEHALLDIIFPDLVAEVLDNPQYGEVFQKPRDGFANNDGIITSSCSSSRAPRAHYGTILSGSSVVKSGAERDRILLKYPEALCFEMEAAGVMNNFPCIVIRGLSDLADEHKSDLWQPYAALSAAAFAKEYLHYLPVEGVARSDLAANVSKTHVMQAKAFVLQQKQHESTERHRTQDQDRRRADIRNDFLDRLNMLTKGVKTRIDAIPNMLFGTMCWANEHEHMASWLQGATNLLLLTADPGCGKSVLAKHIFCKVSSQEKDASIRLSFFFDQNGGGNSFHTLLASLLLQTLEAGATLSDQMLEHVRYGVHPGEQMLCKILFQCWEDLRLGHIRVIIDGIDDCTDGTERLFEWLRGIPENYNVRVLITSRPYIRLEEMDMIQSMQRICGEDHLSDLSRDIETFINHKLSFLPKTFTNIEQEVRESLFRSRSFSYVWLKGVFVTHSGMGSRDTYDDVLDNMQTLHRDTATAYESILRMTPQASRHKALLIMKIMVWARRPLKVQELWLLYRLYDPSLSWNATFVLSENWTKREIIRLLRHWCGLFIVVFEDEVHFLHSPSATKFLAGDKPQSYPWTRWQEVLEPDAISKVALWLHVGTSQLFGIATALRAVDGTYTDEDRRTLVKVLAYAEPSTFFDDMVVSDVERLLRLVLANTERTVQQWGPSPATLYSTMLVVSCISDLSVSSAFINLTLHALIHMTQRAWQHRSSFNARDFLYVCFLHIAIPIPQISTLVWWAFIGGTFYLAFGRWLTKLIGILPGNAWKDRLGIGWFAYQLRGLQLLSLAAMSLQWIVFSSPMKWMYYILSRSTADLHGPDHIQMFFNQ